MKKMRKYGSLFLAAALAASLLSGCSSAAAADGTIIIRFSLSQAATEPTVLAAEAFKEEVEEMSGGSMIVEVYADNQLGNERDSVEGLQLHTVEMTAPANAVITNFISELGIFSLPMLFENKDHVYAVLDDIGMSYSDICEDHGMKLLGWFDLGSRNIMTVSRPINSIEDVRDLKIRTQESIVEMDGMSSFGATSTPMSYNELYTALSSSVIDGAEAANTNYYAKAFYEVAPNWAMVGWLECVNPVLMDLEFWNQLSAEQQAIVEEASNNMIQMERELYAQSEDECLAELEQMESVNITYPDRELFQEAAQATYQKYAEDFGGMANIEAILHYDYE